MTSDAERTVLDAAKTLALRVRAYNAIIDRPAWSAESLEYIAAANAMEAAEQAVIEAAEALLDADAAPVATAGSGQAGQRSSYS